MPSDGIALAEVGGGGGGDLPNPLPVSYPALLTAVGTLTAAVVALGVLLGTGDDSGDHVEFLDPPDSGKTAQLVLPVEATRAVHDTASTLYSMNSYGGVHGALLVHCSNCGSGPSVPVTLAFSDSVFILPDGGTCRMWPVTPRNPRFPDNFSQPRFNATPTSGVGKYRAYRSLSSESPSLGVRRGSGTNRYLPLGWYVPTSQIGVRQPLTPPQDYGATTWSC